MRNDGITMRGTGGCQASLSCFVDRQYRDRTVCVLDLMFLHTEDNHFALRIGTLLRHSGTTMFFLVAIPFLPALLLWLLLFSSAFRHYCWRAIL